MALLLHRSRSSEQNSKVDSMCSGARLAPLISWGTLSKLFNSSECHFSHWCVGGDMYSAWSGQESMWRCALSAWPRMGTYHGEAPPCPFSVILPGPAPYLGSCLRRAVTLASWRCAVFTTGQVCALSTATHTAHSKRQWELLSYHKHLEEDLIALLLLKIHPYPPKIHLMHLHIYYRYVE